MAENNRPVHQVRIGRIKAAVFSNGDNAPRKVQFTALYKVSEHQHHEDFGADRASGDNVVVR